MQLPQFTQDMANRLFPGQRSLQDQILGYAASGGAADEIETVTSGTVTAATPVTHLSVTGTQAYTLPNPSGPAVGLRKRVQCTVAASTPAGTLTVTTPDSTAGFVCASTFFFDTVGQAIDFIWTGTAWRAYAVYRAGGTANNVVVGTTVLTGLNMWSLYSLSVTGTVASTTTKGIPNGSAVGEIIRVGCATAASTPSGTISLAAILNGGGASTTLGTFAATTNYMALRWNGTAWEMLGNTTVVLS